MTQQVEEESFMSSTKPIYCASRIQSSRSLSFDRVSGLIQSTVNRFLHSHLCASAYTKLATLTGKNRTLLIECQSNNNFTCWSNNSTIVNNNRLTLTACPCDLLTTSDSSYHTIEFTDRDSGIRHWTHIIPDLSQANQFSIFSIALRSKHLPLVWFVFSVFYLHLAHQRASELSS